MEISCPLCGSNETISVFTIRSFLYRRCVICKTLFVSNPPSFEDIHALYSEEYYEAQSSGVEDRQGYPSYMEHQKSLMNSFIKKLNIVQEKMPSGRLLDAGAAYGTFLIKANESYECMGIDVSEYAVSVAREVFKMNVQVASIENNPPFPDDYFDVIVMWDIIEHLVNPIRALREVNRMLKPGGYVFISTDDADNWLPKLFGSHWWALGAPLHLCHFSRKGFLHAFERSGNYEAIDFVSDTRDYSIPEIIEHFGVSYQNNFLADLGKLLGKTVLGKWYFHIKRPEQFIALARKKVPNDMEF